MNGCFESMTHLKNEFWIVLLAAILALSGCGQVQNSESEMISIDERILATRNPVSYVFPSSISQTKVAIKESFQMWRDNRAKQYGQKLWNGTADLATRQALSQALQSSGLMHLLWKGDGDALARELLKVPGNENDAYIYGGESPVGESQVYMKDGQPLIYFVDFHLHLTALSSTNTRVDIITYGSRVVTGVDNGWSPHGPSFIFVEVDPTSVEEYEILLEIGKTLAAKGMPALVVPGANSPQRKIVKPRKH